MKTTNHSCFASILLALQVLFPCAAEARSDYWHYWKEFYGGLPFEDIDKKFIQGTYLDLENLKKSIIPVLDAEDRLKSECIGSVSEAMLRTVAGVKIVVDASKFKNCEKNAEIVRSGNKDVDYLMRRINKIYRTNYSRPTGDQALVAQWIETKKSFRSFGVCDEYSAQIIYSSGDRKKTQSEVIRAHKQNCPAEWASLFGADLDPPEKAKDNCPPPDKGFVRITPCSDEPSPSLENDLSALEDGQRRQDALSAGIPNERKSGSKGSFKRSAESSLGQLGRNSLESTPIYGGVTGKILGTIVEANDTYASYGGSKSGAVGSDSMQSNSACDPAEEQAIAAAHTQEMNAPSVKNVSLDRQQCVLSRIHIKTYERMLTLARKCNAGAVGQIEAALQDLRRQERSGCASR